MAKIIAFANQKGGVGKTTSSINLAACLSAAEKRTLLIDLDPQGNASSGVGMMDRSKYTDKSIYQAIVGNIPMEEAIYKVNDLPFLDVCPSDNNLAGAEVELAINPIGNNVRLKKALGQIAHRYDYIIIDCPPSLGLLSINALCAAHKFVVPMQTEYYSLEGLTQLMNTVNLIQESANPGLELEGILLTLYDKRLNLHRQVATEVQNHFGDKVFEASIPREAKIAESPSFGKPVILYDIESKGSLAYFALAKEMIMRERAKNNEG